MHKKKLVKRTKTYDIHVILPPDKGWFPGEQMFTYRIMLDATLLNGMHMKKRDYLLHVLKEAGHALADHLKWDEDHDRIKTGV